MQCEHSLESYATILHLRLFVMLYSVAQIFQSLDHTMHCDHSTKILRCAVLFDKVRSNFLLCIKSSSVVPTL